MLLDDDLIERAHQIQVNVLKATAQGLASQNSEVSYGPVGTGYALCAGEGSPLTQVFGFAHLEAGDATELDRFYEGRVENWEVTVTPFTDQHAVQQMARSGYLPDHFEALLGQRVGPLPHAPEHDIREVGPADESWHVAMWRGWTENESQADRPEGIFEQMRWVPSRRYLAYVDGQAVAGAALFEFPQGVMLAGAATRKAYRG